MHAFAVIVLLVYFAPTIISFARDHQSRMAIFVLNLLFGWTVFGWFFAFIWSLTGVYYRIPHSYRYAAPPYPWRVR